MSEHSTERDAGLLPKYEVTRLGDQTGKHDECRFFVLDPQHDPIAREALRDYAVHALSYGYLALYQDLERWLTSLDAEAVTALADRWAVVLDECKAADPRWILDRSVTTLETCLNELRRALDTSLAPPAGGDPR